MSIVVICESEALKQQAKIFAQRNLLDFIECNEVDLMRAQARWNIDLAHEFALRFTSFGVRLTDCRAKKAVDVYVDFTGGARAHRRIYGGGGGQAIAKAVGISKNVHPSILDATAGLGGDAFVLGCLGCTVDMLERSSIAFILLEDGLLRGYEYASLADPELLQILQRLQLKQADSIIHLQSICDGILPKYDVVYLDPMFPEVKSSAKVKKEMQAFHNIIGQDLDADSLLHLALSAAKYRVVVKRPRIAPYLANTKPSYQLVGKSSRFDIYTLKKMGVQ